MRQSLFSSDGQWYKGNLHAHTTLSDGNKTPQELAESYRAAGYQFLAITDHNLFAAYPELSGPDFLMLPAVERDIRPRGELYHCIHAVGLEEQDCPVSVQTQLEEYSITQPDKEWQSLVDEMRAAGQLVILAHPVWSRMSLEELLGLEGSLGIELYNHTSEVKSRTGWSDYLIDCCLRAGQKPLLFASDDCHCDPGAEDRFGGWIQVKAQALTQQEILRQIRRGNFYASTGPEIYDLSVDGDVLCLECSPCESIHFITYECRGKSLYQSGITSGLYRMTGEETFVRCECIDKQGRRAFTNPVYPTHLFGK